MECDGCLTVKAKQQLEQVRENNEGASKSCNHLLCKPFNFRVI